MTWNLKRIFDELLTTFFFVGKVKFAPGTIASIIPLSVLFIPMPTRLYVIGITVVVLFLISLLSIKRMELIHGDDSPQIVIDEIIGMLLVLFSPFIVFGPVWALFAFAFFRLFDIFKPYPIHLANNKKGSFWVLFDDVLAAVFAWVALHCIYQLSNIFGIYYIIKHFTS
jgi:phosphatidylglycerophosphatase A